MICQDLWPIIISYVSLEDLRCFSRASPLFDEIICEIRPNVFYDPHKCSILDMSHVVIQTDYGKKYLLMDHEKYYIINGKNIVKKLDIAWKPIGIKASKPIFYDVKKDILVSINLGITRIMVSPPHVHKHRQFVDIQPINNVEQIHYINIECRTYKKDEFMRESYNNYNHVRDSTDPNGKPTIIFYGRFKVLYQNGRWLTADEQ